MKKILQKGMTLIELMVSIAIFTIITSVVIFNNSEFNSNVLVTNLSYEVALAIRQAQTYGLSVKNGADYPFGIYVDTSEDSLGVKNNSIIIFGDKDKNGFFGDGSGTTPYSGDCIGKEIDNDDTNAVTDTCEEKLTLRGNVTISKFCVFADENAPGRCIAGNEINWASILFKRPNPVAVIYGNPFRVGPVSVEHHFEITISSGNANGKSKTVRVERTGQISVIQ